MTVKWLENARQRELAAVLNSPVWTGPQRKTIEKMNQTWLLEGQRTATRKTKSRILRDYAQFLKKPFEEATRDDVKAYLAAVAARVTKGTLEGHKRVLKSFYRDLLRPEEPGHPHVVSWIRLTNPLKLGKRITYEDLIKPHEIVAMANAARHPRDRALIMLLYDSGMRIGELLGLRVKDIEFDQYGASANVTDGKTGARKVRLIHSIPDVQQWLSIHPDKAHPEMPLFVKLANRDQQPALLHDACRRILNDAANAAGIKKPIWAHLFRHSNYEEWADTLGEDLARVRYGWDRFSPMPSLYRHRHEKQVDEVMLAKAGIKPKESAETRSLATRTCIRCQTVNSPAAAHCTRCSLPLDTKKLLLIGEEFEALKKELPALLELVRKQEKETQDAQVSGEERSILHRRDLRHGLGGHLNARVGA